MIDTVILEELKFEEKTRIADALSAALLEPSKGNASR